MTEGVQQVWATELTDVSATQKEVLGAIRFDNTGKVYKYVQYTDGTDNLDMVAGDVVYWDEVTGYAASLVSCDVSDNGTDCIGAGVVLATVTADLSFIWIQISGIATVAVAIGVSATDGQPLTCGTADKALELAIEGAGDLKHVCAVAVDASAKIVLCQFPW